MKKIIFVLSLSMCFILSANVFAKSNDGCQALFGGYSAEKLGALTDVMLGVSKTGGMVGSDGTLIFTDEGHSSYGLSATCSDGKLHLTAPNNAVDLMMSGVDSTHVHVSGSVLVGLSHHESVEGDLTKR